MKVYIDQKVQDQIILLSVTRINDSRIIVYPKDHFRIALLRPFCVGSQHRDAFVAVFEAS